MKKTLYKGNLIYTKLFSINDQSIGNYLYCGIFKPTAIMDFAVLSRGEVINDINFDHLSKFMIEIGKRYLNRPGTYEIQIKDQNVQSDLDRYLEYKLKKDIFPSQYSSDQYKTIIYEIFEDEYGYRYGKEILTGLIFPLLKLNYLEKEYTISFKTPRTVKGRQRNILTTKIKFHMDTMSKCIFSIINSEIASTAEIEKYTERGKLSHKYHRKKILELYNQNVFSKEVTPKEEANKSEKETQDKYVSIMENIEFLLRKLRKIDKSQADLYEQEYLQLLKEDDQSITLTPLNQITLSNLEAKIELAITLKKRNSSDIREFLESFKEAYLDEFINGSTEQTKLTISELDKITELFLRTKECYTVQEQRNISKSISFIYLMEVYENKDTIESSDLENSYFSDNLKGIIIYIETLMELGIIKKNMIVDLEQELTVDYILNLIKNIEFNYQDKSSVKKLIKEI